MDNVGELSRRVSFPVYQDTRRNNIWSQLNGRKDDFLIYDRCGYLTYHIPFPQSLLNRRNFQLALWDTYFSNPCNCELHEAAGSQSSSGTSQNNQGQDSGHEQHGDGYPNQQHHQTHHQSHHHHNHHHHQEQDGHRSRRMPRHVAHHHNRRNRHNQDSLEDPLITLHTNRWAEILSNRISKCRFDDTLCHILYSNRIRYRRRHAHFVDRLLNRQCERRSDVRSQCLCPTYADTAPCACSRGTTTFDRRNELDMLYCACSEHNHHHLDACICKTCNNYVESTTCPPGERQT